MDRAGWQSIATQQGPAVRTASPAESSDEWKESK